MLNESWINEQFSHLLGVHSPLTFLLAFAAGILTSLTPCVYPIIPIIVTFIGARKDASRFKAFQLSLFYVLGMSVTYTFLGLLAAWSGSMFGKVQSSPWTNLLVGLIFILFGLYQLDLIPINLPVLTPKKGESGFGTAFFIGLTSGVIASPCAAPVLGSILIFVADKQDLGFGALLMFVYSLGMGLLFLLLGTFTGLLASIPKTGNWSKWIKYVFAAGMFLIGGYLLVFKAIMRWF